MSSDMATIIALITAIGGLALSIASFISLRRFREAEAQAKQSDAYSILINALRTNAMTIDELMTQLADLSSMQRELRDAEASIARLNEDLNIERAARMLAETRAKLADDKITRYLNGIYELTQQLIERGDSPRWHPDQTGPLKG